MILKIIHNGKVIPKVNNEKIYDDWEMHKNFFVFYIFKNPEGIKKIKPGDMGTKVFVESQYGSKNDCIVITKENQSEYPEYLI